MSRGYTRIRLDSSRLVGISFRELEYTSINLRSSFPLCSWLDYDCEYNIDLVFKFPGYDSAAKDGGFEKFYFHVVRVRVGI